MVRRGRPTEDLVLSDEERQTLVRWARRPTSAQALALRCRIVLECAEGGANVEVADRLGVTRATVGKWRRRFVERRLDGLHDEPRPGVARSVSDEDVERVVVKTLEETPKDATHWSIRSMAAATGMSRSTVNRIWQAFGLKPHLRDTFKLSPDPLFVEKVRDIVGLYVNPPRPPWCCAWMRRPRCRRSTAPHRSCQCDRDFPSGRPTTTSEAAPPISTPHSTWPRGRSSPT